MRCLDFLSHYSSFRDGLVADGALLRDLEAHLAVCGTCARYHASVTRGVDLLKHAEGIEPSPDFRHRLRGRLAAPAAEAPIFPAPAGVAAALMFTAALTLGAYEISARRDAAAARTGLAAVAQPVPPPPATMPYAAATRVPSATDLTLTAFRRRNHHPRTVVETDPVPLGTWASLPR
jgi:hypothetical protein